MDARIVCGPFTFHVRANEGALIYFVTEPTGRQERRTGEAQKRTVEAGDSKLAALTKGQQQEMESKELKEKPNKYAQTYNELKLQHTDIKGKLGTKEDELSQQKKDFSEACQSRDRPGRRTTPNWRRNSKNKPTSSVRLKRMLFDLATRRLGLPALTRLGR